MDPSLGQNSKTEPETKKSEKRKNKSSKTAKNVDDIGKNSKVEKPSEIDSNIIHYAHKLEYQLANTREKIQSEKNKFQHIISGLVNYLEENDGTSQMLKNYLKRLDSEALHEPPPISNFERLFTTNKYQIIEEPELDKMTTKKSNKTANDKKELVNEEDQKAASSKKKKEKSEATSKPKTKKQKPSKNVAKDDNPNNDEDDVEIIEMPPQTKENPRDVVQPQYQIPALDPLGSLLQNQNLSAEQLNSLLSQQANPNDILQSYLMLQGANPSLLAGMQGFDLGQYEKLAQEMMKMGGNPQQYYK